MIQLKVFPQIFTERFLQELKQDLKSKTKPPKSMLEALKHSTDQNFQLKKKIQALVKQNKELTQQNHMLIQMVDRALKQRQQFILSKNMRLEKLYNREQNLVGEKEQMKSQIAILRIKLQMNGQKYGDQTITTKYLKSNSEGNSDSNKNLNDDYENDNVIRLISNFSTTKQIIPNRNSSEKIANKPVQIIVGEQSQLLGNSECLRDLLSISSRDDPQSKQKQTLLTSLKSLEIKNQVRVNDFFQKKFSMSESEILGNYVDQRTHHIHQYMQFEQIKQPMMIKSSLVQDEQDYSESQKNRSQTNFQLSFSTYRQ